MSLFSTKLNVPSSPKFKPHSFAVKDDRELKMAKRTRVPGVLWRMFRNRARTLSETIVSLIPQHCNCNGRGKCLRCVFGFGDDEAAMTYLIRADDPQEYRNLMIGCFVVLPLDAPSVPSLLSFSLRCSQLQIVERIMETFFNKQDADSNVICSDYEKFKMLSTIAKLLTCSIWDLSRRRVGDGLMNYLLMHTLIFMPIEHNGLWQVAGPPVTLQFSRIRSPVHKPRPVSEDSRHQRKRKRATGTDTIYKAPPNNVPLKTAKLSSGSCKMALLKDQCSEELEVNRRKRVRLPSWQRRKNRRILIPQETDTHEHSTKVINDNGSIHAIYHQDLNYKQVNQPNGEIVSTLNKDADSQCNADVKLKQMVSLTCQCCSVFRSLSPVPKDAQIKRTSIFYNMQRSSSLFLRRHILYSLKPGLTGANWLLRHIFRLSRAKRLSKLKSCFHKRGHCSNGSSCLYHSLLKLLKVFLYRAKRCQHLRLLKKHCFVQPSSWLSNGENSSRLQGGKLEAKQDANPYGNQPLKRSHYSESAKCKKTSEVTQKHFGMAKPYCSKGQVVSFIWAVSRSIIPVELLGRPSFQRMLRKNISRFVKLRRFEKFSLRQCMHKLEISKFPLLSNKHSFNSYNDFTVVHGNVQTSRCELTLLEMWIFWFFAHIVVPLLQANFYVTESEHGKNSLFYYRKSVWKKLSDRLTVQLEGNIYRSLSSSSVRSLLSKRSFGFSKVRFCPKEMGARPIANLKAPSRLGIWRSHRHAKVPRMKKKGQPKNIRKVYYLKSVNTVLRDLHVVFKDLKMKEPDKWGSTVFCYDDIYRKLSPFLRDVKKEQAVMPFICIVVSDVQKAFDTVSQDKLLSIVDEMKMEDEYSLFKSREIFCRKKVVWVSENFKLRTQGTDIRLGEMKNIVRQRSGHTILVNQEHSKTVKTDALKFILKEHLQCHVIKIGQRFFRQIVGIPQGSVLSSSLCSLYYGHLERNFVFPLLAKFTNGMLGQDDDSHVAHEARQAPRHLLLRFVDDFLFLSTSKKQAASLYSRLRRGFREYNCYMNLEKFGTNFDTGGMSWLDSKKTLLGSDGTAFLCWSGLLINSHNLEVQVDYTRYLHDHLSSTLTVSWEGRPGRQLKAKLCAYMRPKCHPIFFDETINSPATVRLNVYQAFVLCAMKFHCHVRELSSMHKLHPRSCFTSIEHSIRYMYKLMKRRMYLVNRGSECQSELEVANEQVEWLGFTAYIRVLKRKQSRHKALLRLLRAALLTLSKSESCSSDLSYAVDDSHSSFLWKIKY